MTAIRPFLPNKPRGVSRDGFYAWLTRPRIDEVALKRGGDPMQLGIELLKNTPRGRKVVERVAEMANWRQKREGQGLGFAFMITRTRC